MTLSVEIRDQLVDLVRRDLIGPLVGVDVDLEREALPEKPSRWYVGGFIVPADHPGLQPALDEEEIAEEVGDDLLGGEVLDSGLDGDADESETSDQPPRDRFLPSSIGLTVVLPEDVREITLDATWGDYKTEPPLPEQLLIPELAEKGTRKAVKPENLHWVRLPGNARMTLDITRNNAGIPLPGSAAPQRPGGGLEVAVHQRTLRQRGPDGGEERLRIVSVFLVNRRKAARAPYKDVCYAFQARIELTYEAGFYPRMDSSTYDADDRDLRLGDLHYRDVREYAVGRNASAGWEHRSGDGPIHPVTRVWTDYLPQQEVERVVPSRIGGVEFRMERLAAAAETGADDIVAALASLPVLYSEWRTGQERLKPGLAPRREDTANELLDNIAVAEQRIGEGIELLRVNPSARQAFALMNTAMAMANRRREAVIQRKAPQEIESPAWRPFQLAFVLLNLVGMTDRNSPDRELVDLLFFPTGGGKTEAYLGLAAYAIVLRRLRSSGVLGAGVSVIMRYTLRLLTLDQLSRAAGLICALELLRTRDDAGRRALGDWPIEIGLWVGGAASPNNLKPRNSSDKDAATTWLRRYQNRPASKSPVPLKACPWCGTAFKPDSFHFTPNSSSPQNLALKCENAECDFTRDRRLPVLVVDEPIYRRLPAFLIATVDKFASLPWIGQSGAFFGNVDRYDPDKGFYGASEPGVGRPLGNGHRLDPPDLIVQDELHLISGPLGTVAGLYEAAIDLLASRQGSAGLVRPKIVASTATVRRAEKQIAALFDRTATAVFPPPGIERTDSFFAETVSASEQPARLYIGVASQGRGPKLLFLRTMQALLAGSAKLSSNTIGAEDPADPYLTVLAYFNALRELGGARRIVEDEVREHVASFGDMRRRISPPGPAFANRHIRQPLELTSRVSTDDVAVAKERLSKPLALEGGIDDQSIDVALATNMISVGLDISRLGLMLVQGQPKTAAEYIQATSRVGRATGKPGLVVTVLNLHKPRDRTHYEQFRAFHASFYRAVEATSVTPFAPRALDRALAAVIVSAVRHLDPAMTPSRAVGRLEDHPYIRDVVVDLFRRRGAAAGVDAETIEKVADRIDELLEMWQVVATEQSATGVDFTYDGSAVERRLLQYPLDRAVETLDPSHQQFVAARSMRDVEHAVFLKTCDPFGRPLQEAEQD
ncbi:hypothetical protein ELG65_15830 [Rhizobium leguminosarum]|uniref:DISARM system helicase DrmA n=1 Tax=Rhizobium leguminosarum TaxID=384 RepID=UPI001030E63F|nr:DISARM system helicase DrmA [Rhizobium leguminosarum]TBH59769.1 hypothetical protein ELG65_15830 [Rhizobium leguminosarum]